MKRLEDYMDVACEGSILVLDAPTETPEAPPAPVKPAAPPAPEPLRVPPPQPLPGPQREPSRIPMPDEPPRPVPYTPPLPVPLRPVCGESLEFGEAGGQTRIFELDIELEALTMPDLEAMVRGK